MVAAIRALGGESESLPLTIEANGAVIHTETISIAAPETERLTIPIQTGEFDAHELTIRVTGADATRETTIVLADEPAGAGTQSRPYQVTTGSELAYVDLDRASSFELADDIDLSKFDPFIRIGELGDEFSGTFDGQFNQIQNLTLEESLDQFEGLGLFGNVLGATIKNLHLVNVDVTGADFVGGLVGMGSTSGEISGVSVSGRIRGDRNVGGIIGGTSTGMADRSDISISETISHAVVEGGVKVAGIIGQTAGDPIEKSYVRGRISGNGAVGGIVGRCDFGGTVSESYVAAALVGDGSGIVADMADGSVSSAYWDTQKTGLATTDGGGTALMTDEMTGTAARENLTGFDFEGTWQVATDPDDYPGLRRLSHPDPIVAVTLEITSPVDGEEVHAGRDLPVTVEVVKLVGGRDTTTVSLSGPGVHLQEDLVLSAGQRGTVEFVIPAEDVTGEFSITAETEQATDTVGVTTSPTDDTEDGGSNPSGENGDGTTRSPGDGDTTETQPGPGIMGTLVSLGGAGYLLKRRLPGHDESD